MNQTLPAWSNALPHGFAAAGCLSLSLKSYARIVCVGMGGSGVAGQLLRAISAHYGWLPIETVDGPVVPSWYGDDSLFIVCSYSGNTWEVLAAYSQLVVARYDVVVISSGGALAAQALQDHVPMVVMPPNGVPRDMLPYFMGALFGVLHHLSYDVVPLISGLIEHWHAHGGSMQDRQAIEHLGAASGCHVWGVRSDTDALAYRVQTQLNENGKIAATTAIIPELHHNLLVGFTPNHAHLPILLLMTDMVDARLRIAVNSLEEVMAARGIALYKPRLLGDNWLHQVASGLWWADSVSHHIGAARGQKRAATVMIDQLKQTFSKKVAIHEETTSS